LFRHCITPSPSSAEQPSSTKGTPAGASPAGVTTNPWGLSGRPARTSGRRPDGGQLADAGTLGPVTALTLAAALPGMGSRTAGGSTDPGSLCRRGGRLRPTCPCPCRVHPCRACPCRRCHARCWVGPPAQCAGCWWTHRHRLDPRHQPSGMRWAGCSADGRPAPRHVPAPGAATAVGVWESSTARARTTPMRAPSRAPTTTRNWPRRQSDRSTGPPTSNMLSYLAGPQAAKPEHLIASQALTRSP
jgi:hypothetical protein